MNKDLDDLPILCDHSSDNTLCLGEKRRPIEYDTKLREAGRTCTRYLAKVVLMNIGDALRHLLTIRHRPASEILKERLQGIQFALNKENERD